jgi:hypothetical protein
MVCDIKGGEPLVLTLQEEILALRVKARITNAYWTKKRSTHTTQHSRLCSKSTPSSARLLVNATTCTAECFIHQALVYDLHRAL